MMKRNTHNLALGNRALVGLLGAAGALGLLMPTSAAHAFSAQNFHGAICQANSEIPAIVKYTERGIKANEPVTVRCPLMTVSRELTHIGVNVKETALSDTQCVALPVDFKGNFQGPALPLTVRAGSHSQNVPIPDAAKGPTTFYTVVCELPAGQTLTSINVTREP